MGVTEMTKLHHLCTMFRDRVMDVSDGGHYVRMDLPYRFSNGCRAIVKVAMRRDGTILVSDGGRIAMHEPLTPEDVKMICRKASLKFIMDGKDDDPPLDCEMYKITDQDGFGLAVWDIIHAIVLAHDCAME